MVKNLPAKQKTWVQSLGWEGPLEKEMATHSSVLAWEIPWTEEPGGLQSTASQRVGHNLATKQQRHQIGWENSKYFCKPILSTQDYFCREIHQSSRSPGCWFFFWQIATLDGTAYIEQIWTVASREAAVNPVAGWHLAEPVSRSALWQCPQAATSLDLCPQILSFKQ